jgi:hypothetical protein
VVADYRKEEQEARTPQGCKKKPPTKRFLYFEILALLRGALAYAKRSGGLLCAITTGHCLTTLRVANHGLSRDSQVPSLRKTLACDLSAGFDF